MGFDLDKIGGGPGDPAKKGATGFDLSKVQQPKGSLTGALIGGGVDPVDFDEYRFQPKTNADNNKLRAQDQGFWESSALRLGNIIPNIAGGIVEGAGYLGALATEWGDDRDYSNGLTQFGNSMKNPWGTVYRENPEKVWDMSDPAWWGDAFFSLVESAASFAVEGAGIAKVFEGISSLAKVGTAARIARAGAMVATSATLAYTEGAQIGAQVFDDTYQAQFKKLVQNGMTMDEAHDKAKHIASQAAATTVQLNTLINTALNLPEVAPLFTGEDEIAHWFKTKGARQKLEGETYEQWAQRIKNLTPENSTVGKIVNPRWNSLLSHYGTSALSEGVEELNNNWAEKRGRAAGKNGGKGAGLGNLLEDLGHWADDTMDSEGALSFILGAAGGIAHPVLLDSAPIHKVSVDENGNYSKRDFDGAPTEDGKYKTKYVSSRTLNSVGHRNYFENIKQQIVSDIDRMEDLGKKIAIAHEKGDKVGAEQLKMQLFDVGAMNSVQLGIGDSFSAQFQKIHDLDNTKEIAQQYMPQMEQLKQAHDAETDPVKKQELAKQITDLTEQIKKTTGVTEAMQAGYAKSMSDSEYKRRVQQAMEDIGHYQKLWKDISSKYSVGDEWHSRYADYLFGKEIAARRLGRIIQDAEKEHMDAEARRAQGHPDSDPVTSETLKNIQEDKTLWDQITKEDARIRRSLSTLSSAEATEEQRDEARKHLQELAEKYGITGVTDDAIVPGAHRVLETLRDKAKEIHARSVDQHNSLSTSEGFTKWREKNPNKSVVDYVKAVAKRDREDLELGEDKASIAQAKVQHEHMIKELTHLRSSKGRQKYIKEAKATHNKIVNGMKAKIDEANAATIEDLTQKRNVNELDIAQRARWKQMLEEKKVQLQKQLKPLEEEARALRAKLKDDNSKSFLHRLANNAKSIRSSLAKVLQKVRTITNAIRNIDQRLAELEAAPASTTQNGAQSTQTTAMPQRDMNIVLAESTDQAVREWVGDDAAYNDMLDQLWAIQGKDEVALQAAIDIAQTTLDTLNHPFFTQDEALANQSQEKLLEFLERKLFEAGKYTTKPQDEVITDDEADTDTQHQLDKAVLDTINGTKLSQEKKADLAAHLAEYENQLSEGAQPKTLGELTSEIQKKFKLSQATAAKIAQAFEQAMAAKQTVAQDDNPSPATEDQVLETTAVDIEAQKAVIEERRQRSLHVDVTKKRGKTSFPPGIGYTQMGTLAATIYYTDRGQEQGLSLTPKEERRLVFPDSMGSEAEQIAELQQKVNQQYDSQLEALQKSPQDSTSQDDVEDTKIPPPPDDGAPDTNIGQPFGFAPIFHSADDTTGPAAGYHAGMKLADVMSVAMLTHEYWDVADQASSQETRNGVTVTSPSSKTYVKKDKNRLNPNVPLDYLRPGGLVPGDFVTLVVDTNWKGTINDDNTYQFGGPKQVADDFSFYDAGEGKVKTDEHHISNVPIKIVNSKGQTIGYVRRGDWVTARYPGAIDYRNVADVLMSGGEIVTDNNVQEQYDRIMNLRRALVNAHNNGQTNGVITKINSRSRGVPTRTTPGPVNELLPDANLPLVLLRGGQAMTTRGETYPEQVHVPSYISEASSPYSNTPGVIVKDATGRSHFEPIWTNTLGEHEINTVIRAIEIYMAFENNNVSEAARTKAADDAEELQAITGFDVTTPRGLQGFINQYYYYSSSFSDADTQINAQLVEGQTRKPEFKFAISQTPRSGQTKVAIRTGISFMGRLAYADVDAEGRLNDNFQNILKDQQMGMASRFRNVVYSDPNLAISGIGSRNPISEAVYNPESGTFTARDYQNYTHMIKSNAKTSLDGRLQLSNGDHVYFAHPVTTFDESPILSNPRAQATYGTEKAEDVLEKVIADEEKPTKTEEELDAEAAGMDFDNPWFGYSPFQGSLTPMEDMQGERLTLENLEKMRTFTPVQHRNGKTAAEVLMEMRKLGLTTIANGHNPFYTC